MASELRVNTLKDASGNNSVATSVVSNGTAKAWVNLTQVTTTSARDSYNVASLTDNGTGKVIVNYTSSMADTNYVGCMYQNAFNGTSADEFNNDFAGGFGTKATGSVSEHSYASATIDAALVDIIVFGDLA